MSVTSPEIDRHITRRRAEPQGGRPVRIDREGPGGILPFDIRKPTPGLTGSEIAALRDRLPTQERGSGGTADDEGTPVTDAARPDALAATPPGLETRDPGASPLVPLPPRARDLAGPRRDGFAGWDCLASRIRFSVPASFLAGAAPDEGGFKFASRSRARGNPGLNVDFRALRMALPVRGSGRRSGRPPARP